MHNIGVKKAYYRSSFTVKNLNKEGSFPIQKIMLQIFAVILKENNEEFTEKKGGGHANPKKIVADFIGPF